MRIIREDNIANLIILAGMFVITSLMAFSSYYFISKQYEILEREISDNKDAFVVDQRKLIRREVDAVIELIKFKTSLSLDTKNNQKELISWIRSIRFGENKENYIFVYDVKNFKGGDNFAKMLINANRPDLEGKYISTEYKDANGKKFREEFLEEINIYGYAFSDYMYKKLDSNEIRPKVSYFKLYPKFNWIIGAGAYLDEIDKEIAIKKASLNKIVQTEITLAIVVFLFFSLVANGFAIFFGKQIEKVLKNKNAQVKQKTDELENLNMSLSKEVEKEVEKRREQEQLLIQKSKFIALGEMVSNIAHQWRQPLSQLSAILMTIKFKHDLGKLDVESMQSKNKEAEYLLDYMSSTIDDFRDFFKPSKEQKYFFIKDAVNSVINIIGGNTKDKSIHIDMHISESEQIYAHRSEYEQVILNIITNAINILISEKIVNPTITIDLYVDKNYTYLKIGDNAGGIKTEPIEKVFEPYFTTKEESGGTGIGLYMSKLIIEKSMGGILTVKNCSLGATFVIRLKREKV